MKLKVFFESCEAVDQNIFFLTNPINFMISQALNFSLQQDVLFEENFLAKIQYEK